jgi:hypothetical protein
VGPKKVGAASVLGEADRFFLNSFAYFSFSIKKSMWGLGLAPIFKMQDFKLNPQTSCNLKHTIFIKSII